jgi:predicted RNA-binding Zn ribbon-like protein
MCGMDAAELPLVGGHPALDLVNTVERGTPAPGTRPRDHLADPPGLLRWVRRVGLADEAEADAVAASWDRDPGAGDATLAAVREVREALHTVLLAATGAGPADPGMVAAALERLHGRWAGAVGRSRLVREPEGRSAARLAIGGTPAQLLPDRAADAALDVLRGADLARLRRCPPEAGGCGWLFLDRSRNGSRRWCRMADCGSTVKARRLTERRRAARTGRDR